MEIESILNAKSPATGEKSNPQSPQMSQPQLARHGYYSHDALKAEQGLGHLTTDFLPERANQYSIPPTAHGQLNSTLSNVFSENLPYPGRTNSQPYSQTMQQQYATAGLQESSMTQNAILNSHIQHPNHSAEASTAPETSQPKSFSCATCLKGFARRSDLARHERIHSGHRPHACPHEGCKKEFIQRSALTVHERVHTGEKPHICESCAKPFSDSSSLARHRRIHSGKRPYKCPYPNCQKTFTRKTTLTRHQNHHFGTIADAAFARDQALASRDLAQSSRQHESEAGRSIQSDIDDHSEATSSLAASSPGQQSHIPANLANPAHHSSLQRRSSDLAHPNLANTLHSRAELHHSDSTSTRPSHIQPLLSQAQPSISITSDPSSRQYRHPKPDPESSQYQRDNHLDSPHMSTSSWSVDSQNGVSSHALGHSTPEYATSAHHTYYHSAPQPMYSAP